MKKPIFIVIAGASGSGKTTISEALSSLIDKKYNVAILSQDNFYNEIDYIPKNEQNELNFDHPDAFNWKRIIDTINSLLAGTSVTKINKYDFSLNKYSDETIELKNIDILIFEGIYTLYNEELFKKADLKIFIKTDPDECLIRRIERDIKLRGRCISSITNQWRNTVKPMYDKYIFQTYRNADIILPWDKTKENIIDLIAKCIELEKISKDEDK